MKKLFLHYGIHRTGTTSIQRNLKANALLLEQQGISYPDLGVDRRHQKIAWGLASSKIQQKQFVKKLIEETVGCNKVVLSAEDFCQIRSGMWLKELNEHFDVHVILYLKRQDLWLESWYNQHIKWPWSEKFSSSTPEFFVKHVNDFFWLHYNALIEGLEKNVPHEKIYCNTVGRGGVRDTLSDVLTIIGADSSPFKYETNSNQSLTKCQLDIVRSINLLKVSPAKRIKIINAVKRLDIVEDNGSKSIFSAEQIDAIRDIFEGNNKKLVNRYPQIGDGLEFSASTSCTQVNILSEAQIKKYLSELVKDIVS